MLNTFHFVFPFLVSPSPREIEERIHSFHSRQCGLIPISVSANHFLVFGRRVQAKTGRASQSGQRSKVKVRSAKPVQS